MSDSQTGTTNSFSINVKVNEVEIITLKTKCTATTIVSDLKKIISKERNITKWEVIELKCNGNIMSDNQTLAVYDVICDKHLIYLQIKDFEPNGIEIEGEQTPINSNKELNEPTSKTTTTTTETNYNNNNYTESVEKENKCILIFSTIFLFSAAICHSIGLYAFCKLRDEWKMNIVSIDDNDVCTETVNDTLSNINLVIGGLSFCLAMSIIFLSFCYCLYYDKNGEIEQGSLGCSGCWMISLILTTVFLSMFLFGDNLKMVETDCNRDNNRFWEIWIELNPLCYFCYSSVLLQWLILGSLFLYYFCRIMFE